MMYQTGDFIYGEDIIFQVLVMPYTGNDLSMVIILPREIDGLQGLEELLTIDSLKVWPKKLSTNLIDAYFPRFKMNFQFDLKKVLTDMGMKDTYDLWFAKSIDNGETW